LWRKALFVLRHRPGFGLLKSRFENTGDVLQMKDYLEQVLGLNNINKKVAIHYIEHHPAHLASTFFVSPFSDSAVLTVDGFGDFVSTSMAKGENNKLSILQQTFFPHSLGMLYPALTQYLGFLHFGDEFKVMGLAPYGNPIYVKEIRKLLVLKDRGRYELDLSYFNHWTQTGMFVGKSGEPKLLPIFTAKLEALLGPARKVDQPIEKIHEDLAASLQVVYEEGFFHALNALYQKTKNKNLCLAGGCAMNSVANGKIFDKTPFTQIYIQPAAGDNGTSLGAAFYVWHQIQDKKRSFVMEQDYWGPRYAEQAIKKVVLTAFEQHKSKLILEELPNEDVLCQKVANYISDGLIVGWFQGRMEWGARALGNRSILADPRRRDMREIINTKIKFRERFRPFAPSILEESVSEYFEINYPDPFMLKVYPVKKEKREIIPAVTHVDGSGRLQTVSPKNNSLYYKLIKSFEALTGVPVILNTSFNENEPIVNKPEEALDCFLRTSMDVLVMGSFILARKR
jgi:carbamoyltransferase